MDCKCVKKVIFIFAAALIAGSLANDGRTLLVETRLTVTTLSSTIVGAGLCVLCSSIHTAPWMWPIIESAVATSLACLFFGIYKDELSHMREDRTDLDFPVIELVFVAIVYFASCLCLYGLRSKPCWQNHIVNPLAKTYGMFCDEFNSKLLFYALERNAMVLVLFEPLIFYVLWLIPQTFTSGPVGWNFKGALPSLPGTHHIKDTKSQATWSEHCDTVAWGGAASGLCYIGLSVLHDACCMHGSHCNINAPCAWHGLEHGFFWACTGITLMTVHFLSLFYLSYKKSGSGFIRIFGFIMHAALAKACAMCGLNFIRHFVFEHVCRWCFDRQHTLFADVIIAYAAVATAMLQACAMALVSDHLPEAAWPALYHMQNASGIQAAKACAQAFSTMTTARSMFWLFGPSCPIMLALGLSSMLCPMYVSFVRPATAAAVQRRDLDQDKAHKE